MSLTDLKRRKKKSPTPQVAVDDFIADADNYAFGELSELSRNRTKLGRPTKAGLNKQSSKIYRHQTFSLTEDSIVILQCLASHTKIAKSRLLRILIYDFYNKSPKEQMYIISNGDE